MTNKQAIAQAVRALKQVSNRQRGHCPHCSAGHFKPCYTGCRSFDDKEAIVLLKAMR